MSILNHASVQIPDAAVQAGVEAIELACTVSTEEMAKEAITAAFRYLSAPCAVEVKKLDWDDCTAGSSFGLYTVSDDDDGWYFTLHDYPYGVADEKRYSTPEQAKAAAQADFERRILSCVVSKTVDQEAKDFEAIGRAYMATFETVTSEKSEWEGYTPSECPSELLLDIYAAQQEAKPVDVTAGQSDLDARLKAAGMYSVAELMAGTPVDKWRVHSGMDNLQFFGEWLERKAREYKVMTAGYDIGDKDKSDDLYEWSLAHSGAFHDVLVNFRAAIRALSPAEPAQGEQLPQDVINLVIAGREMVYSGEITTGSNEAEALEKALEAFASRIPWENEPDEEAAPTPEAAK